MIFQDVPDITSKLRGKAKLSSLDLHDLWEQRRPVPEEPKTSGPVRVVGRQIGWVQDSIDLASRFTDAVLKKEEFLLVCDAAKEIVRFWGESEDEETSRAIVHVRTNYATALMRLGFTREARRVLEPCASDTFVPRLGPERRARLFLKLGDILREESLHLGARASRLQAAQEAIEFYERALALDPENFDPLGRTAAGSLIVGDRERAHELGRRIIALAKEKENSEGPSVSAARSRAVAHAVLGEIDEAARAYGALEGMGVETSELADARFYAQFLAEALGQPRDLFKKAFPPLELIVCAGHMPDLPGAPPRFPENAVESARQAIAEKLNALPRVGLISAAAGADLLFADEMLKRPGGAIHVILAWAQEDFRQGAVRAYEHPNAPGRWEKLFENAVAQAVTIRSIGQLNSPASDVGWQYLMEVTAGLALHVSRVSRLDVRAVALWTACPGAPRGGTADFAEFWTKHLGRQPDIVPIPPRPIPLNFAPAHRSERKMLYQEVKSILFADIYGYSKLAENVIPEFINVFLERVSQLASKSRHGPRSVNTWGDAVYAVFDFAQDAGAFALELVEMVEESWGDWVANKLFSQEEIDEHGQPIIRPLNVRIGLHTGPVFMHYDPVVRRLGFTGEHVNRAARIEPIAKPGEVFASEEFAAMAELSAEIRRRNPDPGQPPESFICEYAGSMALAKKFPGTFRIYRVLPKRVFAIERLAQAAHESYLLQALHRGETRETNPSTRPWSELPEDLKDANRAQVADIPVKLRKIGYELAPGHGIKATEIQLTAPQVEELAMHEHKRWMADRRRNGWTYGTPRDNGLKKHPCMVKWEELNETEREKDRDAVRNMPRLIEQAGFRVRKLTDFK